MNHLQAFILPLLLVAVASAKLPSSFIQCDRKQSDFQDCLNKAIENAIHQMDKPFKEMGLISLEPIEVPSLSIGQGTGPVEFAQNYENLKLSGVSKTKCFNSHMDFEKKTLQMNCTIPKFGMDFHYRVRGRLLLIPLYGEGHGNIIFPNLNILFTVHLEEYEKQGIKYFKVKNHRLIMKPETIKMYGDNLFDGNKLLGDNIKAVFNENWREIFDDVGASYEDAWGKILSAIFDGLLAKVPIEDIFGKE